MKPNSNIPTEENLARAKEKMRKRLEFGAKFKSEIKAELPSSEPCHDIWVWCSEDKNTISYIFPNDEQLNKYDTQQIQKAIYSAAKNIGIEQYSVEYHSHEYVLKKYNGNYDKYFR